ncbi:hypothetical protein RF11_01553 [Thelohanellus kitauei]|uniref:Uncharacterized protein n=1 Tax=Thelohanellus kitauei TaxID=669202 RepID=A0A0C2J5H8_THEKT|nr:hypothetical protein RF11_01553 [Thelohanellus kitauei]
MNKQEIIGVDTLEIVEHHGCLSISEKEHFRTQSKPVEMLFSKWKDVLKFERWISERSSDGTNQGSCSNLMNDDLTTTLEEVLEKEVDSTIKTSYFSNTLSFRVRNIMFIDESPFKLHIILNHERSRKGTTPNPLIRPRSRSITHSKVIQGFVNTEVFKGFLISSMNVLRADEESVFFMENVNFYHNVTILEDSYFLIKHLPPCSPMRSLFVDRIKCSKEHSPIRNPRFLNKNE